MIERIVVVNDSSTAKGGATGLALASILSFRHAGYAVTLLTGDSGENEALRALDVEVVPLGQARILSSPIQKVMLSGIYNRPAMNMIADWIKQYDTPNTVYHLHGWAQILSPSIFSALSRVQERLVLSAHDFFLVCPNGSYSFLKSGAVCSLTPQSIACVSANCDRNSYAHKLWRVARQAVRRMCFSLDHSAPPVLAIHERMRPFLERGGVPERAIRTLPNPVQPFLPERVKAESNNEVVFIGRLEDGKGPDLACAAARRAGAALRLIGDGPMAQRLQMEYPSVTFFGRLPSEEIAPLVSKARVLVMPSRYPEPYGLVAAEALWSGIPVIAAETAFLAPDIVARGAGLACEPRDTERFAAAMRLILDDDVVAKNMSMAAFNDTHDLGSTLQGWIDALVSIYEERLLGAQS